MSKKIKLTPKEEAIMSIFWKHGALFVKEVIEILDEDPQPHYNTIATFVKGLEAKGMLSRQQFGNTHRYFPIVSEDSYRDKSVKGILSRYFNGSGKMLLSNLIEQEEISIDEIRDLLKDVEKEKGKRK